MRKPCGLKVRKYADRLIGLNEYLDFFPGETLMKKNGVTKLNEILPNSMPNSWSKQAYAQGFDCGSITLLKVVICLNAWIFLDISMKVQ